jgi:GH15 family glucan-1,4-alpha-glucosidase
MARPITLSNGELHVGLNNFGLVHDFYYPYVGLENHAAAKNLRHKVGVWVDGQVSWLDDDSWEFQYDYHDNLLISKIVALNNNLGIRLEFDDFVDSEQAAFIRNVHIINLRESNRDCRIYFHQVFVISNSHYADTVQYLPDEKAILHYKNNRVFIVNGQHASGRKFDQFSCGLYGVEGHDGTFRDSEDGKLSGNPVEHGASVDSVIGFEVPLEGHDSQRVYYWVAAGKSQHEALAINDRILREGPSHRLMATSGYWHNWLKTSIKITSKLPENLKTPFMKSLIILKSQIDKRGAVIASLDTTMLNYSRDSYAYAWPRDGAYTIWPLVRLGYTDEPLAFFDFCKRTLHRGGYLMHKYTSDGQLASSWHPYHEKNGQITPPIQTDETAIVLFVFAQYCQLHKNNNQKLLSDYYASLVAPMANFLAGFIDHNTRLPRPSYDLWERLYQTTTYTTAVTYGALVEASKIADDFGANDDSSRWRIAADDIKANSSNLYSQEKKCFIKGICDDGSIDDTVDISSSFGAFMFGLFDVNSTEVKTSIEACQKYLKTSENHPGLARFVNDEYDRKNPEHVGNPWFVTTLWMAQYLLEIGDREGAQKLLDWATSKMLSSGTLSEQLDPETEDFISVAPLTWSQAEYLSTVLDFLGTNV